MTILKEEIRKARKHHNCDACHWFNQSNYGEQDVTPDDLLNKLKNCVNYWRGFIK